MKSLKLKNGIAKIYTFYMKRKLKIIPNKKALSLSEIKYEEELRKGLFKDVIDRRFNLINYKRIINSIRANKSHKKGALTISNRPLTLFIESTNICNLTCPSCPTGNNTLKRPKGHMSLEMFKSIIDELGGYLIQLFFWNYGEPTLNPNYIEMLKYAKTKAKGLYIQMDTNGTTLDNDKNCEKIVLSGLDRITISLDGVKKDSYKEFRGLDFYDKVSSGIQKLSQAKERLGIQTPFIEVQFILMKTNETEVEEVIKLAKKWGADEVTLRYFIFRQYNQQLLKALVKRFLPEKNEYGIYAKQNDLVQYKRKVDDSCYKLYSSSCILWNGDVVPCCYDAYQTVPLGNIQEKGFMKLWNGPQYILFRNQIKKKKNCTPLCSGCHSMETWVYTRIPLKSTISVNDGKNASIKYKDESLT